MSSALDQRATLKLQEKDLALHAGRIYLLGRNSPFNAMGGPWRMHPSPPGELAAMFDGIKYAELANRVTKLVEWPRYGWESIACSILVVVAPPFAPYFLAWRREIRVRNFLKTIARIPYDIFTYVFAYLCPQDSFLK
jgi:hypothetical protein